MLRFFFIFLFYIKKKELIDISKNRFQRGFFSPTFFFFSFFFSLFLRFLREKGEKGGGGGGGVHLTLHPASVLFIHSTRALSNIFFSPSRPFNSFICCCLLRNNLKKKMQTQFYQQVFIKRKHRSGRCKGWNKQLIRCFVYFMLIIQSQTFR